MSYHAPLDEELLPSDTHICHRPLTIAAVQPNHCTRLYGSDRALLVWMTRIWPGLLDISRVVKPETILRWHRSGFKAFWSAFALQGVEDFFDRVGHGTFGVGLSGR